MRPTRQTSQRWPRHKARAAVGLLAVLLAGLVVFLLLRPSSSKEGAGAAPRSCNGAAGLCERRLNEVVFAGTHNSFAASAEPGWYFANQRYGISRQLDDGIRALLIDVHFGVYDAADGARADRPDRRGLRSQQGRRAGAAAARCASPTGSRGASAWGR